MLKNVLKISVLIKLILFNSNAWSVDPVTGAFLIERLETASHQIAESFGDEANVLLNNIDGVMAERIEQLNDVLGEKVTTPINELTGNLRFVADQAVAVIDEAEYVLSKSRECLAQDANVILSGFYSTLENNLSSTIPWSKKDPIVHSVRPLGIKTPYVLRAGKGSQVLNVIGSNFKHNKMCNASVSVKPLGISISNPSIPEASFFTADRQKISLSLSNLAHKGQYGLEVKLKKKGFFGGCVSSQTIQTVFEVLPEANYIASYEVIPFCENYKSITEHFSGSKTNSSTRRNKSYSTTHTLQTVGAKLSSYDFHIKTEKRAKPIAKKVGNGVNVSAHLPDKGWDSRHGSSKISYTLKIHGLIREDDKRLEPISYTSTEPLKYGESKTFKLPEIQNCKNPSKFSIFANLVTSDNFNIALPVRTSNNVISSLTETRSGARYDWDATSKSITISTPENQCGL